MSIGRLYFAMVDPGDTYDSDVHSVEDLQVFNLKISQSEGEFARAELIVINPREGLLIDTRKYRLFISCEETEGSDKVLLFSGRITGFPSDLSSEMVTLEYIAQPDDWDSTQADFIEDLRVAPYYNDLFVPAENRTDPAQILAGYSSLIHWNRMTEEISLSDILQGSDKIIVDEDFFFDSLQTNVGDPPLKTINLNIEAQWNQIGVGVVNCAPSIAAEFTNSAIGSAQINTLTPLSFEDAWSGARIPTGYEISESILTPVADGFGLTQADLRSSSRTVAGADYPTSTGAMPATRSVSVPRVWYAGRLKLLAVYEQKRRENLIATVSATQQQFSLTSAAAEDMFIRLEDPVAAVNGSLLDPSLPSFFYDIVAADFTDAGRDVVECALMQCRARLAKAVRCVETSVEMPVENILQITCDHSLELIDDRLPGQTILGKVVGYQLEFDGDSGKQLGSVTIASSIGTGFDSVGTGGAKEHDIAELDYDTVQSPGTMASAIYYSPGTVDIDVPIDVAAMESDDEYLIDSVVVDNDGESQNTGFAANSHPDVYLQDHRTGLTINLKSMNPASELDATVGLTVEVITFPRQVDLGTAIYDMLLEDGEQMLLETGDRFLL